ncbi:MAG TPA: hypothetical protein VFE17_07915 [Candidatus Baltobacteraceae bacterium]|jgi:hypothetical protein|nr:hypothetical protein [Candidatus Baltobacteraceae bacterium]
MSIRTFFACAVLPALAFTPALALADLHVDSTGAHRIVASVNGDSACQEHRSPSDPASIRMDCPSGSRGTLTVYRQTDEGAACEVDFWPQTGTSRPWHAILSHQNASAGACAIKWTGPDRISLTVQ